jgi:hypothetical protein
LFWKKRYLVIVWRIGIVSISSVRKKIRSESWEQVRLKNGPWNREEASHQKDQTNLPCFDGKSRAKRSEMKWSDQWRDLSLKLSWPSQIVFSVPNGIFASATK